MKAIKFLNVSKSFGDKNILNIDNLEIQSGEKIGIVGKNGSGKSTLFNLINRDIEPDTGTIEINGNIAYLKQLDDITSNRETFLSGGEKMIEAVNKKLQEDSNILLADEPSTNLDMFRIEYLVKKFKEYKGTLLIISHDRNLLDSVCNSIIEISNGKLNKYNGNYTKYKEIKGKELQRQNFEYDQYVKEKERLKKAIIVSSNSSKSVKKAPKRMGNSEARLHRREATEIQEKIERHSKSLETRLNKLERKEKPEQDYYIHLKSQEIDKLKNKNIIYSDNFSFDVNGKRLFENTKFYVQSNDKIALVGKNGSGKTTLLNQIMQHNDKIKLNPQVNIGYFKQNLDNLIENKTVLENVMLDSSQNEVTARNTLANLHIKENEIFKKVNLLSGGEKVKVSLAKLLLSNSNVLILDEPTNFLDIESIEALEKLLNKYEGTVFFVSHDRKFIDNICNKVIIIENKKLIQFDGNYSEYKEYKARQEKKDTNSNDNLLINFRIAKLNSEIAITKDEKEKQRLEEELNNLKHS